MAGHNQAGSEAERAVAEYLAGQGFKILDINWKTKWCEIDIVAKKDKAMHFVEVKYRGSSQQGGGFDYITDKKLYQMRRAAELWVSMSQWDGEYILSAAEVSGDEFEVSFLKEI